MVQQPRGRVLSQADVRVSTAPIRVGDDSPAAAAAHVHASPDVSVQRNAQGDVVEIHVRCACGQTTVIDCQYPA